MLFKSEVVDQAVAAGWPLSSRGWGLIWARAAGEGVVADVAGILGSDRIWPVHVSFVSRQLEVQTRHSRGSCTAAGLGERCRIVGCLFGLLVAAYTGSLLTATNQPIWSDSVWIASLFLTSAASSSIALMLLIAHWREMGTKESLERLERADLWALAPGAGRIHCVPGLVGQLALADVEYPQRQGRFWPLFSSA